MRRSAITRNDNARRAVTDKFACTGKFEIGKAQRVTVRSVDPVDRSLWGHHGIAESVVETKALSRTTSDEYSP